MALCGPLLCPSYQDAQEQLHQGAVQGVAGSFGGLASIVGLIIGGILYDTLGGTAFLISAAVIFVAFIMSFRLLKIK